MPKSKIYLPDINVWLALMVQRHAHHKAARRWFEGPEAAAAELAFCRVTQAGVLRLLTRPAVMAEDTLTQEEAWRLYREVEAGGPTVFLEEPPGLDRKWESISSLAKSAFWNDGYLEAFAQLWGATVITFDRGFVNRDRARTVLL